MPGILPMKVIKVGNAAQARIAQACDRCRSKKIRCDGLRPCCSQCSNVGFECKTSDKLSRRAFPRGYTESLEERVRALELEVRELKDLLDAKDDKIDMLSKLHSNAMTSRRSPSFNSIDNKLSRVTQDGHQQQFRVHQSSALHSDSEHDPRFVGTSNSRALHGAVKSKAMETGRACPDFSTEALAPVFNTNMNTESIESDCSSPEGPSRLLSDQMVNVFFQEWAPLFPILHRPSFLKIYEQYVADAEQLDHDDAGLVQLHLVFGIATLSNKARISYDLSSTDSHWLSVLESNVKTNSLSNLQCLLLAQLYCIQTGDWARVLRYKDLSAGMAFYLGLNQSQKKFALNPLLTETRKKIFWSLYTLDCFTSAMLGTPTTLNDRNVHCESPIDVDDEYISEQGIQPVLPGEFTKLSSALSLFSGARILSKVLAELYPSHASYDVSMSTVSALDRELEEWFNDLPSHLKMQFTDEKPSTNIISSRCPLLSLTFHYVRTMIHRQAACFAPSELSSVSTVTLATSSKHIIQILALLDERNLSYSFCLNKDELLATAGSGVVLQSLSISRESKLMKDCQKTVCLALEMLKKRKATGYSEFKRMACALTYLGADRRPQLPRSGSDDKLRVKREVSNIAANYTLASQSSDAVDTTHRRATLPVMSGTLSAQASANGLNRRFRTIAPSTTNRQSPYEMNTSSPRSSTSSTRQPSIQHNHPGSTPSAASSTMNLDFLPFPTSAPSYDSKKAGQAQQREQHNPSEWEKMLSNLGSEQLSLSTEIQGWSNVSGYLPSQEDQNSVGGNLSPAQAPYAQAHLSKNHRYSAKLQLEQVRSNTSEEWSHAPEAFPREYRIPFHEEGGRTTSLFSFSEESLTSGEEFSSLDWGTSSGEGDDAFKAVMCNLTPEEVNAFGYSEDPTQLHGQV